MFDYQELCGSFDLPCCVISVEKKEDGSCGEIRIICGNSAYHEQMPAFHDNMLYSDLVPKDTNFENFLFRCVFEKRHMHAYVETRAFKNWTDQHVYPLQGGDEKRGYCLYFVEHTEQAKASLMASVSINTAQAVIEACIKMQRSRDFKSGMDQTIAMICEHTGADMARIILIDSERKQTTVLSEATDQGLNIGHQGGHTAGYPMVRSWEQLLNTLQTNCIIIKDEYDFEYLKELSPEWISEMRRYPVNNLFMIPLKQDEVIYGYLYIVNFDSSRLVEIKEFIELVSFFLGSEIANRLMMVRLDRLSRIDILTNLNNRYAMRSHIETLLADKRLPFGAVVIDLNGLKHVNDLHGHEEGDRFIVSCVDKICEVFSREEVYRIGGDEFAIISEKYNQKEFAEKIEELNRISEENEEVSFSCGSCWVEEDTDPKTIFRLADEDMYKNKREFYLRHPEKSRRNLN